jgi:uncharacterized repeat protein (TIGR03803 family)
MKKILAYAVVLYLALFAAKVIHAQTYSVVYNFGSQSGDPFGHTNSGIIAQGRDGNLYSGSAGGRFVNGANFMVTPTGALTTLYSFTNSADGSLPYGGLTLGTDGNFYGTAYSGNQGGAPFGTVFRMTPAGTLNTLYTFTDGNDGEIPLAPPIQGVDGNFYGTTCGWICANGSLSSYGSIYKITPSGVFTTLHTCTTDCYGTRAPLVQATDGAFYGVAGSAGPTASGSVFKITPTGAFTVLYNFSTNENGGAAGPLGPLIQGSDGNFYGTASVGGYGINPCGIVFRMTPKGALTVIHSMKCAVEGGIPFGGVIQATDGNLYGVNSLSPGCASCGNVFKITPSGVFSIIYEFSKSGSQGQAPYATLYQHTNGLIYGITFGGGTGSVDPNCASCGVLFSLDIGASPFVSLVSRAAKVGQTVQILGQGFTGATAVSFNGVMANFKVVSDTFLAASVPTGATSGPVTVTTPNGTVTSNKKFYVLP